MAGQRLDDLGERLALRTPQAIVRSHCELLDARVLRLAELLRARLERGAHRLEVLGERLDPDRLTATIGQGRQVLAREQQRLQRACSLELARARARLEASAALASSLSPERVLERGYVIVRAGGDGRVLTDAAQAQAQARMTLVFADGQLGVLNPAAGPARRRRAGAEAAGAASQPSLL
jgi:exodeoxyribonuclease VII large subunit